MSGDRERWSADEIASLWVVLSCAGMMAFGVLFYIAAKTVTHQLFARCLAGECRAAKAATAVNDAFTVIGGDTFVLEVSQDGEVWEASHAPFTVPAGSKLRVRLTSTSTRTR